MICARSCKNLLNFAKVMPKIYWFHFFSGHGVLSEIFYSPLENHRRRRPHYRFIYSQTLKNLTPQKQT